MIVKITVCLTFLFQLTANISFGQDTQKDDTGIKIVSNEEGYVAMIKNNVDTITPFVFISLTQVTPNIYLFSSDRMYRGKLQSMIDSSNFKISELEEKVNINFETDQYVEIEDVDEYNIFQGLIDINGEIIGGEGFRMVEVIQKTQNPVFFMVQSQEEFDRTENGDFAIMNELGIVLSEFHFENVSSNGTLLRGHIVTDEYFRTVDMNFDCKITEILNETPR